MTQTLQTEPPLPPTQNAIAATVVAVAPVLTVIAITPILPAPDESDHPQLPNRLYLRWLGDQSRSLCLA